MDRFKLILHGSTCHGGGIYCPYDNPTPHSSSGMKRLRSAKKASRKHARSVLKADLRNLYLETLEDARVVKEELEAELRAFEEDLKNYQEYLDSQAPVEDLFYDDYDWEYPILKNEPVEEISFDARLYYHEWDD